MTGAGDTTLSVVLVTYDSGDSLQTCIDSLAAATKQPFAVVVVDNGSSDGAPERAAKADGVTLVRSGGNIGYGAAANLGARQDSTPWLLVANPDVVFEPGSIDAMLAADDRWPSVGVLGPGILTADGRLYPSSRAVPSLGRGVAHAAFGWWWPSNPWTAGYRREQGEPEEGPTGWLSGSCLLLRRSAFEAVGGFDPGYFMYFEDLDLCERIGKAGYSVVYVPTAVVVHEGGHSASKHAAAMSKAHHASAYRYLALTYDAPWQAPLRAGLRAGLYGRYLLSRQVAEVGHGAQPVRSADLLRKVASEPPPQS